MKGLFFLIYFSWLINHSALASFGRNTIILNKVAEQAFDAGNFRLSKELLYLQISFFNHQLDSTGLHKTWVSISALEILMNRPHHAMAALQLGKQFALNRTYHHFGVYNCIQDVKNESHEILKNFNTSFCYKLRNSLIIRDLKNTKSSLEQNKIDKIINELKLKKDTMWFGYCNLLFKKGEFLYKRMDYKKCLGYFSRSIQISKKINSISNESLFSYKYFIDALLYLGKYDQGSSSFNEFVKLYDNKLTDKKMLCEYFTIKGGYYYTKKMYLEANIAYELSINIKQELGLNSNNEIYYLIGSYFYMGEFRKVIDWSMYYKGKEDSYYKLLVAYSYLMIGKTNLAGKLINKINKTELIKQNKNRPLVIYWLSDFYMKIKNYRIAEHFLRLYFNQSRELFSGRHFSFSQAYSNMAYFDWVVKENVRSAIANYQRELCILLQETYHSNYFKLPDISRSINNAALAKCLRNKGEAFLELSKQQKTTNNKMKYLQACLDNFDLAFQALSRHKFALLSEEKQLSYTNLTRHYYSYVIECCYQMYMISGDKTYAHRAFTYIEKSKASVLLSIMKGTEARKLKMVPEWVKRKEDYIRDNTVKYARLIADENNKKSPDYALIDQYNNSLQKLDLQQDTLIKDIKGKFPAYYQVKYGAEVATVTEVQHRLKKNQVLVQFALNKTSLFIFFISKDDYKVIKQLIDTAFASDINKYRHTVSRFSYEDIKDVSIRTYSNTAFRLFQTLLEPLNTYIKGKELIIIPDDILNTIPFEGLLTQKVEKKKDLKYKDLPYIIRENSIIYNYSASLFVQSEVLNSEKIIEPRLLAMAPIHSAFSIADINRITRDSDEIIPIPGTINEVKGINKIFKGKILLGKNATEARFKEICDRYQIIHIASHGFVNNERPLFSKLVFNRNNMDTLNDGLLNTYEIYNMHLSAPLIVLSACNTGSGKLYMGEGTISLARGFYVAGAKNIIMTLWAVTDKTSNELVQHFYAHLADSEPVPVSLQKAKLGFLQNSDEISAHPFFWAGYISIGEPDVQFAKEYKSRHYLWIVVVIILLTSIVFFWRKRKNLKFLK